MDQKEKQRWIKDGGPELNCTFENINTNSVVFDIGLYKGSWSKKIMQKYDPCIYGFEPVLDFYRRAEKVFAKCPKVKLFSFGLGVKTQQAFIFVNKDSTSLIKESKRCQTVMIKSIKEFMFEHNIGCVDLAGINIEGAEYDLLDYMIDTGIISKFNQLLIQFHSIGEDYQKRTARIREELALTHQLIYSYDTVWDYWKLLKGDLK